MERVLVEKNGLPLAAAWHFCVCIRETFPDDEIKRAKYEHLLETRLGQDPADHEHSAALVAGGTTVLLSADQRGFPPADIAPARRAIPDRFFLQLLASYPAELVQVIREMGASRHPPNTPNQTLGALRSAGLIKFAESMGTKLGDYE